MAWVWLIIAGLLEVGWAVGLKASHGFTRPLPSIATAVAIVGSMLLLGVAAKSIPIGTAYPVWVGIGACGTALVGMLWLGEPATLPRLICLAVLVAGVAGLKYFSP